MRTLWFMAVKDVRLLLADRTAAFFALFWPVAIAVFFGLIFAGAGEGGGAMRVALVDEDNTEGSGAFIADLEKAAELQVVRAGRAEAQDMVRRGGATAYVAIPHGFGEARKTMFWGDPAELELGMDPSRKAEAGLLQGVLTKYMFQSFQNVFTDRQRMLGLMRDARKQVETADDLGPIDRTVLSQFLSSAVAFYEELPQTEGIALSDWQPFRIKSADVARRWEGPHSSYEVTFPQGMIWGLLGCAVTFGLTLVTERTRGTLLRLRAAPLGRAHILGGKALASFLTMVGVSGAILAIGMAAFGVRPHSWALLALALACAAAAFVGLMMVVSVLGRTEQSAAGIGWALFMGMAMLGGGMVPVFFMPSWLAAVSHVSPVRWAVVAIEGSTWRQFSLAEMLTPCAVLLGVGVASFAVGARLFRWSQEK